MAGLLSAQLMRPGLLGGLPAQPSQIAPLAGQVSSLLATPVPTAAAPARTRVNPLRVIDNFLFGEGTIGDSIDKERLRPTTEAAARARLATQQRLLGMFGGGPTPAGITQTAATPGFTGAPVAATGGGLPAWSDAAPVLAAAQLAGIPGVDGLVGILDKSRPDVQVGPDGTTYDANDPRALNRRFGKFENINGFVTDVNNPDNTNLYRPDLAEGQEPVYDQAGRIVGVRNIDGSVLAEAERVRAVSDAQGASQASYAGAISGGRAAGEAPYQIERIAGPNGEIITTDRASLLGGGPIRSQTPVDAVFAEGNARNQVGAIEDARTRASAANRILPQLSNMEKLLTDINSGYGANVRTGVDRAVAALPLGPLNDGAQRRASSTQTFQGEARQVVSGILPLFGANPTEGERRYAEQMSGADVTYTPEAIREGIRLARARAQREQQNYERLRSGGPSASPSRSAVPPPPPGFVLD